MLRFAPLALDAHGREAVSMRADAFEVSFGSAEAFFAENGQEGDLYLALLRTHSDHNLLPLDAREALLAAIGRAIDVGGGSVVVKYQSSLCLARCITGS
jgi:hypothetical protein